MKYETQNVHNMLSLMLDLKHKSLCLVFSFIDHEQDKIIVEEYDKKVFLTSLVLKCHQLLSPLKESNSSTSQTSYEHHIWF
jgi:hypothetical protein